QPDAQAPLPGREGRQTRGEAQLSLPPQDPRSGLKHPLPTATPTSAREASKPLSLRGGNLGRERKGWDERKETKSGRASERGKERAGAKRKRETEKGRGREREREREGATSRQKAEEPCREPRGRRCGRLRAAPRLGRPGRDFSTLDSLPGGGRRGTGGGARARRKQGQSGARAMPKGASLLSLRLLLLPPPLRPSAAASVEP
ncbi:octapeptide-repeat protein T2-like, partial [Anolis carolinensis]|uniref:octapeptide-repeat protein T2-like n=1 Tax=Anolis carolinensis TaxID=28377 RepID=UPI002F2B372C